MLLNRLVSFRDVKWTRCLWMDADVNAGATLRREAMKGNEWRLTWVPRVLWQELSQSSELQTRDSFAFSQVCFLAVAALETGKDCLQFPSSRNVLSPRGPAPMFHVSFSKIPPFNDTIQRNFAACKRPFVLSVPPRLFAVTWDFLKCAPGFVYMLKLGG